jgi:hypothetical protein
MTAAYDSRRMRVARVKVIKGELSLGRGAEVWQEPDGNVSVAGPWEGVLIPSQEDLIGRAKALSISPLECLRRRLVLCPYVQVEVI